MKLLNHFQSIRGFKQPSKRLRFGVRGLQRVRVPVVQLPHNPTDEQVADAIRRIAEHHALPDYGRLTPGTAVVWGEAGATGVTKTLSFDALASGSARMGTSADLGATLPRLVTILAAIESGTAPTAGGTIDIYLAWSHNNTFWPAGVSGSDGAWPADGNEDEWALELGEPATSVVATNDGTTLEEQNAVLIATRARYVTPVVDNNWSQAIRDETTATDNDSRIYLIPMTDTQEDS